MIIFFDLLALYLCIIPYLVFTHMNAPTVISFMLSIAFTSLFFIFNKYSKTLYFLIFFTILFTFFSSSFIVYLPIFLYFTILYFNPKISLFYCIPLLNSVIQYYYHKISASHYYLTTHQFYLCVALFISSIMFAIFNGIKTKHLQMNKNEINSMIDEYKEYNLIQEQKNKQILESQNNEITLATLNERNRIAREIHDNVGHILSRSIIQVGALISINNNPLLEEPYKQLKTSLDDAMTSIRSSVHNLHAESIDLKANLKQLTDSYTFCTVSLDYDISEHLNKDIKYCFITITKEALHNTEKHSNATSVSIRVIEHPSFYQYYYYDNGTTFNIPSKNSTHSYGIGLINMEERVKSLHGFINIEHNNGFCIMISIPKE